MCCAVSRRETLAVHPPEKKEEGKYKKYTLSYFFAVFMLCFFFFVLARSGREAFSIVVYVLRECLKNYCYKNSTKNGVGCVGG